jgi:hypothetical protein
MQSNVWMVVNTEMERMLMEVVMVLSWQYRGGTEKNHKRLQSYPSFKPVAIKIEVRGVTA